MAAGETLGLYSASEVVENYLNLGRKKAGLPAPKLYLLGILSGMIIGFGAVASATASFAVSNPGLARLVSGLLFAFGLGIVMLTGVELFTGNTMMVISALDGRASWRGVLKNWLWVYLGNLSGAVLLAAGIAYSGQLDLGGGLLAVQAIRTAATKSALAFGPAAVLGICCNLLVCLGVLCSLSAKDTAGRILGAYIPVVLFVVGGFEHCVANMYFIPAGIFAALRPDYAALAAQAGIDPAALGWGGLLANLVPVTLGNIVGGGGLAVALWLCHRPAKQGRKPRS